MFVRINLSFRNQQKFFFFICSVSTASIESNIIFIIRLLHLVLISIIDRRPPNIPETPFSSITRQSISQFPQFSHQLQSLSQPQDRLNFFSPSYRTHGAREKRRREKIHTRTHTETATRHHTRAENRNKTPPANARERKVTEAAFCSSFRICSTRSPACECDGYIYI